MKTLPSKFDHKLTNSKPGIFKCLTVS